MFEVINGQYTIRQILKDNADNFFRIFRGFIRTTVINNVAKVLACGNKDELGYSVYACPICSQKHAVAHTCKSRFCNRCGKVKNDDWIVKSQERLLNVPHKHLVFTIPSELWMFFRR